MTLDNITSPKIKKREIEKKRGLTQDYSNAQKVGNQQETIQMRKGRLYGQRDR